MSEGKKNIGVFFGSRSPEHDISIITGQLIIAGLKGLGYSVTPIYITKKGGWMIGGDLSDMKLFIDSQNKIEEQKKYFEYYLDLENSGGKMVFKKKGFAGKSIEIEIAFPALHGSFGEDGTIQGLFEMLNVPYVGCNVASSAIAMDKVLTKQMYEQHKIPTTKFVYFFKRDFKNEGKKKAILENILDSLKFPVFVKPVHLGSSIGIAKVKEKDVKDLEQKIEVAFYYDNKVLVEESVENLMDVTCCVIGNEEPVASKLQESVFPSELFGFNEKYINEGGSQTGKASNNLVIPARLSEEKTKAIQECAKEVYKNLGCAGIARVDFLYNKQTNEFFANEVNPLPGTLYHHLWKASGVELPDLLSRLIAFALEKHENQKQVSFSFESSVLHQLNSKKLKGPKLKS